MNTLRYYPFAIKLNKCMGSCKTPNYISNKACLPNKTANLNLSVFNMIIGINESKILTKHLSCECKYKFDGRKCNSNQKQNNNECQCDYENPKEHNECGKSNIWNPSTCICENVEYLTSTIDNSVIMCDEIINAKDSVSTTTSANAMRTVSTNFHKKLR